MNRARHASQAPTAIARLSRGLALAAALAFQASPALPLGTVPPTATRALQVGGEEPWSPEDFPAALEAAREIGRRFKDAQAMERAVRAFDQRILMDRKHHPLEDPATWKLRLIVTLELLELRGEVHDGLRLIEKLRDGTLSVPKAAFSPFLTPNPSKRPDAFREQAKTWLAECPEALAWEKRWRASYPLTGAELEARKRDWLEVLENVRLTGRVERDAKAMREELERVAAAMRLEPSPSPLGDREVWTLNTLAWLEAFELAGLEDEAFTLLQQLEGGSVPRQFDGQPSPFLPPDMPLDAFYARVQQWSEKADAVNAWVERVSRARSGVDPMIRQMVRLGQWSAVSGLGEQAIPTLTQLVREESTTFYPDEEKDPLELLTLVDQSAAADLILELPMDDPSWRARVLRLMLSRTLSGRGVLEQDAAWDDSSYPSISRRTKWLRILELLGERDITRDWLSAIKPVARRGALTADMVRLLAEEVVAPSSRQAETISELLSCPFRIDAARPVYVAALGSERAPIRVFGARRLVDFENPKELAALVVDTDALVRREAARCLNPRQTTVHKDSYGDTVGVTLRPIDPELRARMLVSFADDPDLEVRQAVALALIDVPDVLPPELLRSLARDPDAKLRARILRAMPSMGSEHLVAAGNAILDGEGPQSEVIDRALVDTKVDVFPLYIRRLKSGAPPDAIREHLLRSSTADPQNAETILQTIVELGLASEAEKASSLRLFSRHVPERIPEWLERLTEISPRAASRALLHARRTEGGIPAPGAYAELAARQSAPADVRFVAACVLATSDTPRFIELALTALRSMHEAPRLHFADHLYLIPAVTRHEFLRRAVTELEGPEEILSQLSESIEIGAKGSDAVAAAVLERWFEAGPDHAHDAVDDALVQRALAPTAEDLKLIPKLVAGNQSRRELALRILGKLREPESLDWLGRIIQSEENPKVRSEAIRQTIHHMSDDAAEVLLEAAARVGSEDFRHQCLDGLEQIRVYQDARERWKQRSASRQTRDAAVQELLGMIEADAAEVRALAARGLAALEAVEHLPALIRLTQDTDPGVAAAAREAVGALTHRP